MNILRIINRYINEKKYKVGDEVHMAHKHKGGAGVVGKVTKIEGSTVYIKNKEGREFKGQLKNVSDI
jgi:preprotein translocase subunit YajC